MILFLCVFSSVRLSEKMVDANVDVDLLCYFVEIVWQASLFLPSIYCSSVRSTAVGDYYCRPKSCMVA